LLSILLNSTEIREQDAGIEGGRLDVLGNESPPFALIEGWLRIVAV
jgi:hypothetical protein